MRIVIIGAGIIGATLAYALTQRGAEVTIVDAGQPAGGATGASFGWVNASFHADAAHFALRAEGIAAYRRLCHDLALPVAWSGCLCWEEQGAALEAQAADLTALGYRAEILGRAEVKRREPAVQAPEEALFFADEAAVEARDLTRALLDASGARCLFGCPVTRIATKGGRVSGVEIPGGVLQADRVVVAGGTGSAALLAEVDVALPLLHRPGVIFRTQSLPPTLAHVCVAPIGEFRQLPDGSILMPTAVSHQADDSDALAASPDALADAAVARLQKVLPDVPLSWRDVALAQRPVPQDGLPFVGACGPDGLFAGVMHSGITLAPVVAEVLAAQITGQMTNAQAEMIAPYDPVRFQRA